MTLERRLSKLEASILPEVRPPKVVVIEGYRDGEDMDAAQDRHFAAHPEDRGATLVVFLRKMLRGDDDEGCLIVPPGAHPRPRIQSELLAALLTARSMQALCCTQGLHWPGCRVPNALKRDARVRPSR